MKALSSLSILAAAIFLSGCISEDEKEQIEQAGVDLNKLANQIIVTAPAAGATVNTADVIVRADIPSDVEAQSVTLLVDGVEVGKDDDGAPWEISWPAYYWGDGNKHSLLLKTVSESGVELRNQATAVTVSTGVNKELKLNSGVASTQYVFGKQTTLTFAAVTNAKHYEINVAGNVIQSDKPEITLDSLTVGSHEVKYRAVLDNASQQTFMGPYSTVTNVQVQAPYSADQLAITPAKGSLIIKDANSIELQLAAVDNAASYEIEVDGVVSALQTNTTTLTDLTVGSHAVRYRVLFSDENAGDYTGAFSSPVSVTIERPDAPTELQASAAYVDDGYQLTLSWTATDNTQSYEVELTDPEGRPTTHTSETNQLELSDMVLGEYKWKVRRINTVRQTSDYSTQEPVNVGVFRTQLGGSGHDRARQIIKSQSGGYLVRAVTSSREISPDLQGASDDWVIRLDEQGNVVQQYVESKPGRDRFRDMFEAKDGSIYLVGQDWSSQQALIIKLDRDLKPVWENEVLYRPDSISERYDFNSVTEWNGKILVGAIEWARDGASIYWDQAHLHEIASETGVVSRGIELPGFSGVKMKAITKMIPLSENSLSLFGSAEQAPKLTPYVEDGAFILNVDRDMKEISKSENVGEYKQHGVGDVAVLPSGDVAVIGQSGPIGFTLSTFDTNALVRREVQEGLEVFYYRRGLSSLSDGSVIVFLKNQDSSVSDESLLIHVYDGNLGLHIQHYLISEQEQSNPRDLKVNDDDSVTVLFEQERADNNNFDVVIRRIPPIQ